MVLIPYCKARRSVRIGRDEEITPSLLYIPVPQAPPPYTRGEEPWERGVEVQSLGPRGRGVHSGTGESVGRVERSSTGPRLSNGGSVAGWRGMLCVWVWLKKKQSLSVTYNWRRNLLNAHACTHHRVDERYEIRLSSKLTTGGV